MDIFKEDKKVYWEEGKKKTPSITPEEFYVNYLKYAYAHKEDFLLLLTGSKGTKYERFTRELAELDIQELKKNIKGIKYFFLHRTFPPLDNNMRLLCHFPLMIFGLG